MLTWEGTPIQGTANILEKITVIPPARPVLDDCADINRLQTLPFASVQHKVTTLDAQPSSGSVASLLVSITGLLVVRPSCLLFNAFTNDTQVDASENPLQFSQIFQLYPENGSYYMYVPVLENRKKRLTQPY